MIPLLGPLDPFPPVESSQAEYGGLLAAGADLSPDRLLMAYRAGIFPWGTLENRPIWYSPDPRMVLYPDEFRLSRSLRKTLRAGRFSVRFDHDFPAVIAACATVRRRHQDGTWIDPQMAQAYIRLHELGWAHSVETYIDGQLAGGLYGLAIGKMFYGESMFACRRDASKIAFAHLVQQLLAQGFGMIDCQMKTEHLASLGGREIPRRHFLDTLKILTATGPARGPWSAEILKPDW
jgi:leucyl/phenylalanyl-tRNA---protein transferase